MGTSCSVEVPVVHYKNPFRNRQGVASARAATQQAPPPASPQPPPAASRPVASHRRKSSPSSRAAEGSHGSGVGGTPLTPQEQFRSSLETFSRILALHMAANTHSSSTDS